MGFTFFGRVDMGLLGQWAHWAYQALSHILPSSIIIIFFIIFQKKEKRKRKTKRGTYCLFDLHEEPSYEKAYYDNAFGLYLFKILLTQNFQRD